MLAVVHATDLSYRPLQSLKCQLHFPATSAALLVGEPTREPKSNEVSSCRVISNYRTTIGDAGDHERHPNLQKDVMQTLTFDPADANSINRVSLGKSTTSMGEYDNRSTAGSPIGITSESVAALRRRQDSQSAQHGRLNEPRRRR